MRKLSPHLEKFLKSSTRNRAESRWRPLPVLDKRQKLWRLYPVHDRLVENLQILSRRLRYRSYLGMTNNAINYQRESHYHHLVDVLKTLRDNKRIRLLSVLEEILYTSNHNLPEMVTLFVLDAAMFPLVVAVVFLNMTAVCSCERYDWLVYDDKKQYQLVLIKLPCFVSWFHCLLRSQMTCIDFCKKNLVRFDAMFLEWGLKPSPILLLHIFLYHFSRNIIYSMLKTSARQNFLSSFHLLHPRHCFTCLVGISMFSTLVILNFWTTDETFLFFIPLNEHSLTTTISSIFHSIS